MASLVLTLIGDDRPGLVSAVSRLVEEQGGSWQRSQLVRLAGTFAGVALVEVPEDRLDALRGALEALAAEGLQVGLERADPAGGAAREVTDVRLHLVGQDRPGIVAEISASLAAHGVGIDELDTGVSEAPMAGGLLFEVDARLSVPVATDLASVRAELERLADELMVDLDLDA